MNTPFTLPVFSLALPEIFVLVMACIILLMDAFLSERGSLVTYISVQLTLVCAFLLCVYQFQNLPQFAITFSGNYIVDKLALITKIFVFTVSIFAFIYAREYTQENKIARSEYYTLGLFAVLGMQVMASAYSFLTIFLGLELLSLSLYTMVALQKNSEHATEAAMKYFVTGALATGFFLYGVSLVYGVTGAIDIHSLHDALGSSVSTHPMVVILGLVFIVAGIAFKFGAVPFHMWVPDVYHGAPTSVTLFIASAPKIAAFAIAIRILVEAMPGFQVQWEHALIVIALLSMFFGNLLAIAQSNIKRMLAYSSIAHIGYMFLGFIAGPGSNEGYSAAMFYISTYVLVAAGAFAVIALLSRDGVEFDQLNDFRGLNARSPWLAFIMLLLMFSMAGIPPTVGFFAKLGLLEALVQAHYVWLAALALLFAIIGAYYYLRVVMLMYFEEPEAPLQGTHISVSPGIMTAISVNGAAALLLGMFPSALIELCRISVG